MTVSGRADELALGAGTIVGERYRVLAELGRGGMGAVFSAEHVSLGRTVALKVLLPSLATNPEIVERFLREARAAAAIGHPGIVEVFDLGMHEGMPYIAMEKLEGEELADRIEREHPLSVGEIARLGAELADALAASHQLGVVHRDLKPQNVFLARGKRGLATVKVLDFGIAKLLHADAAGAVLTETGRIFGTPRYMAPEQLRSATHVDARTDVYAMGVILYEMITGEAPFQAESFPELVLQIASDAVAPPSSLREHLPPALDALVMQAMSRDPALRPQTAQALAEALERVRADLDAVALDATLGASPPSVRPIAIGAASGSTPAPPSDGTTAAPPPPVRAVWPWVAGAASLLALLALGITVGSGARSAAEPGASEAALAEAAPAPASSDALAAEVTDAPRPAAVEAAVPLPPTETHSLPITTTPTGARIALADESVSCVSPCALAFPVLPSELVITHDGYRREARRVEAPLPPALHVALRRLARPEAPPPLRQP